MIASILVLGTIGLAAAADAQLARIGAAAAVHGRVLALAPTPGAVGRVMQSGKPVYLRDAVTTDANGRMQVMLLDETVFTIGPNSSMALDEFVYDPSSGAGKRSTRSPATSGRPPASPRAEGREPPEARAGLRARAANP